jgi:glycyl-tRNA synthetase beta chain
MSDSKPLLVELGCEELPPKALDELAAAFAQGLRDELGALQFAIGAAAVFCTPRRMAVRIADVAAASPKTKAQLKAVPVKVGWDAGRKPTPALVKKAAQLGVAAEAFRAESDAPNAMLVCEAETGGETLAAALPGALERALRRLPIPKPMRWGDHDYAFVRPLHWLVILHGSDIVDAEVLGIRSGRQSRGHRFHHPQPVHLADADAYLDALRAAHVLADPAERRARIRDEVARAGAALDAQPRLRDALLDEIANLTEWPVAITCAFEREFLRVPQEALIQTMEANQKFVPVFGGEPGSEIADRRSGPSLLTEHFIGIANIASKDPAEIRKGYERVIRPRFADAKFFFDEDLKTPLAAQQEALKAVTYQQQLGSVWDKCVRVAELARVIANRSGVDAGRATRAAALAKCDLMTRMVGEFPELQGTMGRHYASANGEDAAIADALDEFYAPRFAGDAIAAGPVGRVLAVAERIDTLCGIFAVGLKPSGNKDPFALRRAALGLARTLIEGAIALDLKAQLAEALALLPESALAAGLPKPRDGKAPALDAGARRGELGAELYEFVIDRLRGYYAEQGVGAEAFEAVRALAPSDLLDFDRRLRAVVEFAALPEAQALAAANKRISNILRQAGEADAHAVDAALLEAGAEAQLHDAVSAAAAAIAPLVASASYVEILRRLAALREPVDRFFDSVMVMTDDAARRANRLALLAGLRRMFLHVADISLLPAPERS